MSDIERGFRVGPDPAPKVWNPINAGHVAAMLFQLVERIKISPRPGADHELEEVIAAALDSSELARLYCVATAKLGIRLFDFERYCPWCDQEYEEERFADHIEAQHRSMVLA